MQPRAIVERARALGVTLRVEGDRILYSPKSQAPPGLVDTMREHKQDLLVYLSHQPDRPIPCCTQNTQNPQKPETEASPRERGGDDMDHLLAWASELAEKGTILSEPLTFIEAPLRRISTVRVSHHASIHLRTVALARTNQITGRWGRFTREWWRGQERAALRALAALREAMEEQRSQEPQS